MNASAAGTARARLAASHPGPLLALSAATGLAALSTSVVNVALPSLAQGFATTFAAVQWVVLGYLFSITAMLLVVGRLGDRFGARRILVGGIVLFTGASAACAAAPTLELLVAFRTAQGAGAAAMMALSLALAAATAPQARLGRAIGLLGTASAVGTALGPTLGGFLVAALGWPAVFLAVVPLGAAAALLAARFLPADGNIPARKTPLLPLDLLRSPELGARLVTSALVMSVLMATMFVGPFYLSRTLGLAPAALGLVMTAGPAVAALAGVPAGRCVDRCGAGWSVPAGLVAMALGCATFASLPSSAGVAGYLAPLVLITAGYALFQAANNAAAISAAGSTGRGGVSGLLNLSRNLGLIGGASAMGAVFTLGVGGVDPATAPAAAVAQGFRTVFAFGFGLTVAALAIAMAAGRRTARLA